MRRDAIWFVAACAAFSASLVWFESRRVEEADPAMSPDPDPIVTFDAPMTFVDATGVFTVRCDPTMAWDIGCTPTNFEWITPAGLLKCEVVSSAEQE